MQLSIFFLPLLASSCFAAKCPTCRGEQCIGNNVRYEECSERSLRIPADPSVKEPLQYACLRLEFAYGASTRTAREQCIMTGDKEAVCKNVAKLFAFASCSVREPDDDVTLRTLLDESPLSTLVEDESTATVDDDDDASLSTIPIETGNSDEEFTTDNEENVIDAPENAGHDDNFTTEAPSGGTAASPTTVPSNIFDVDKSTAAHNEEELYGSSSETAYGFFNLPYFAIGVTVFLCVT